MGGMCARVCPTETLCEEVCVREIAEGKPVEIGRLQRYATDALFAAGRQLYRQGAATGHKVAVVGAGPAGLACAHKLATLGHAVTLFEARDKPGGLNEYGIAAYKTVDGFAQAEVDWILGVGGIELRIGVRLGRDIDSGRPAPRLRRRVPGSGSGCRERAGHRRGRARRRHGRRGLHRGPAPGAGSRRPCRSAATSSSSAAA